MTRHRDFYYSEDDTPQTIDGMYTEHASLVVEDQATFNPTFDTVDEYFIFSTIQSGKGATGGAAIATVELWEYLFWAAIMFDHQFVGSTNCSHSFGFCFVSEDNAFAHWSNAPTQWIFVAGGTT